MTMAEPPIYDPELGNLVWDEYTDLHDDSDSEPTAPVRHFTVTDTRRVKCSARCFVCYQPVTAGSQARIAFAGGGEHVLIHTNCAEHGESP